MLPLTRVRVVDMAVQDDLIQGDGNQKDHGDGGSDLQNDRTIVMMRVIVHTASFFSEAPIEGPGAGFLYWCFTYMDQMGAEFSLSSDAREHLLSNGSVLILCGKIGINDTLCPIGNRLIIGVVVPIVQLADGLINVL